MIPNQKVYQGVLEQIRTFIEDNDLNPGDKLPSERELSETLNAGRSSVREALRALELLGIIETRHGEGTFLSSYQPFQTVEILASFILREKSTKHSLISTKKMIEKEAAKFAYQYIENGDIGKLEEILHHFQIDPNQTHFQFFLYIFNKTENLLLMKIWHLIVEFMQTFDKQVYEFELYRELIRIYTEDDYLSIETLFTGK